MSKLLDDLREEQNHYKDVDLEKYNAIKILADYMGAMGNRIEKLEQGIVDFKFEFGAMSRQAERRLDKIVYGEE